MALIVEDGTGRADAESYFSVTDADTYHANIGNSAWATLSTQVKEQCLRKATQYLDSQYAFIGYKLNSVQRLEWPRQQNSYYYRAGITYAESYTWPVRALQEACAELAIRAAASPLSPDEDQSVKREKIGPIEVEYQLGTSSAPQFTLIENLLRMITRSGPNSIRIERV